ncbi:MAG: sugar phosphate isomerase/epimerase [Gammaproteobacteria bacterium]|uniref:sugar phosphate isomerase/epimerase family protein n=1 Tax=Pseudomaricurvus alcaniphilus TaxID=1166482 RepID=UPI0014097B18|nr:sugar phosphate isomerase/epimerase family protein [Pseudomaricurvus alcaniphilus]MBR9911385.1 sugar phosphate isomerase/epimerase [Gammaproteobacteria bacterium]NHN36826.1 sugar phosphate isomerase/epimerase [Pseudomaricurvus alcaniphilus]
MKIGTQNQAFFPDPIDAKFGYLSEAGFDGFEIDGGLLVANVEAVKRAISATGIPVTSACGGYTGWIGDLDERRRLQSLVEIKQILRALGEVGGAGMVVPAAWGMATYRLPPMQPPRTPEQDREILGESLVELDCAAAGAGVQIFLEPLNRYQDHMINTLAQARRYIEENQLRHVAIAADLYHMNIEEDDICTALHQHRDLIKHIHLADNQRFQPGTGALDFKKYFTRLRSDGFSGFVTLECRIRGDDPKAALQRALQFLRDAAA